MALASSTAKDMMQKLNAEQLQVNVPTVVSIVVASFSLYFFIAGLIAAALMEAKVYAVSLDIERDEDVIAMYRFKIDNDIAAPNDPPRMAALQEKVARRMIERAELGN
tara:strand:+ start:621 stop:944 length:324 start_codon:yes stop_codon:yes gene_type:complete